MSPKIWPDVRSKCGQSRRRRESDATTDAMDEILVSHRGAVKARQGPSWMDSGRSAGGPPRGPSVSVPGLYLLPVKPLPVPALLHWHQPQSERRTRAAAHRCGCRPMSSGQSTKFDSQCPPDFFHPPLPPPGLTDGPPPARPGPHGPFRPMLAHWHYHCPARTMLTIGLPACICRDSSAVPDTPGKGWHFQQAPDVRSSRANEPPRAINPEETPRGGQLHCGCGCKSPAGDVIARLAFAQPTTPAPTPALARGQVRLRQGVPGERSRRKQVARREIDSQLNSPQDGPLRRPPKPLTF
jgi:hypothetical protein